MIERVPNKTHEIISLENSEDNLNNTADRWRGRRNVALAGTVGAGGGYVAIKQGIPQKFIEGQSERLQESVSAGFDSAEVAVQDSLREGLDAATIPVSPGEASALEMEITNSLNTEVPEVINSVSDSEWIGPLEINPRSELMEAYESSPELTGEIGSAVNETVADAGGVFIDESIPAAMNQAEASTITGIQDSTANVVSSVESMAPALGIAGGVLAGGALIAEVKRRRKRQKADAAQRARVNMQLSGSNQPRIVQMPSNYPLGETA